MSQPRWQSLVEAISNVAIGYGVAVATQLLVFPRFGLDASWRDTLAIGAIFTVVSVVRSYLVRRLFERLRPQPATAGPQRRKTRLSHVRAGLRPGSVGRRGWRR